MAYSILKREKNVVVYQYTDNKEVMNELKMPTTSFDAAKEYCDSNVVSKQSKTQHTKSKKKRAILYNKSNIVSAVDSYATEFGATAECGYRITEKN